MMLLFALVCVFRVVANDCINTASHRSYDKYAAVTVTTLSRKNPFGTVASTGAYERMAVFNWRSSSPYWPVIYKQVHSQWEMVCCWWIRSNLRLWPLRQHARYLRARCMTPCTCGTALRTHPKWYSWRSQNSKLTILTIYMLAFIMYVNCYSMSV